MVEHTAVNRGVVGLSPTRGVNKSSVSISVCGTFLYKIRSQSFQNKILSLMNYLLGNNRTADAKKATEDKTYRNKMLTEAFGEK